MSRQVHQMLPGTKARAAAPTSRGARMVRMRERSSGPGARLTAELPAPSSQHSIKGIVKMPTRFVPTVSSSASAAFPPTACGKISRFVMHDMTQHLKWSAAQQSTFLPVKARKAARATPQDMQ